MSYLNHLAARALQQLPTVQPRLPSRFETPHRESDPGAREPIAYATFTPSSPAARNALPRADAPAVQSPLAPPGDQRGSIHRAEPRLEREVQHFVEPIVEHDVISMPSTAPREVSPQEVKQPALLPTADRMMAQLPVVIEQHRHSVIEPQPLSVSAATPKPIETRAAREEIREHTRLIEHLTLERSSTVSAPTEPRAASAMPKVAAYVPPVVEREPAPEAAPIIQVSIGRIEVRAVPAPAVPTPAPATASRPALSLDDYLQGVRR